MTDEIFIKKYEELLDKGYCDCNEMNCLDNDTPKRILNIVKGTKLEAKQLLVENQELQKRINAVIEEIKGFDYFKGNYKNEDDFEYTFLYVMKEEVDRVLNILEKEIVEEVK